LALRQDQDPKTSEKVSLKSEILDDETTVKQVGTKPDLKLRDAMEAKPP